MNFIYVRIKQEGAKMFVGSKLKASRRYLSSRPMGRKVKQVIVQHLILATDERMEKYRTAIAKSCES